MQESIRRFFCAGCRVEVYICTHCDRGQRFCACGCARAARRRLQREANRRYQGSLRGRLMHSERARRYRLRRKSVTDHGSLIITAHDVLGMSAAEANSRPSAVQSMPSDPAALTAGRSGAGSVHCSFCRRWCEPWIRHAPLRRRSPHPRHHRRERF
jgi:hypothetical protein